jgi:L-ascorbate metabolism protein UlaG (beta-lactamase superfamily)
MKILRWILVFLLASLCVLAGVVGYFVTSRSALPDFSATNAGVTSVDKSKVKMIFLGTSSMLWTDGKTNWMLDGFFSRQPVLDVMLKKIDVVRPRVDETAQKAFDDLKVPPFLAAVFVAHSHYDHSMDAPYLAKRYGGQVMGSGSTQQIALGQGLDKERTHLLTEGSTEQLGDFQIQAIRSAHAPTGFTGGFNTKPLTLPAHALAFKEGVSYMFVVKHISQPQSVLAIIQPSAGFIPGQTKGIKTDRVFLGVGGLGKLKESQIEAYWQELVGNTLAKQVYLIHWDDFTQPLLLGASPLPLQPMPKAMDNFEKSAEVLKRLAKRDGVNLFLLQSFQQTSF